MATLGVTGRDSLGAAFAVATTWGLAKTVTRGIYFSNDGGLKFSPAILTDDSFGQPFLGPHDVGNIDAPALQWPKQARYEDFSYILEALALGSPATVVLSTSVTGQTTSWKHVLDIARNIDGLMATFAIDKVRYIEEIPTAKVHGWDFEDGDGGIMRQTFRVLGAYPTPSSTVNTGLAQATFPALTGRVMMKQGVFRLNAFSAGTLGTSDVYKLQKAKFSFQWPLDAPFIYGQDYVDEPATNGFPTFQLDVTMPKMTAAASTSLYNWHKTAAQLKADWTFMGTSINATDAVTLKYEFPDAQIIDFQAPLVGPNQVKPTMSLAMRWPSTTPSGMPFLTPMRVTRIMSTSIYALS